MIPMLIGISLLAFIISINAPVDPIEKLTRSAESEGEAGSSSVATKIQKQEWRKKLGLDLPIFYFSISNFATTDTLYKVQDRDHQKNLSKLTHETGNWNAVSNYFNSLIKLERKYEKIDIKELYKQDSSLDINVLNEAKNQFGSTVKNLLANSDSRIINNGLSTLYSLINNNDFLTPLKPHVNKVKKSKNYLEANKTKWKTYIPSINWYGFKNQYHTWLFGNGNERKGLIRGDFGFSYRDQKKS